MKKTIWQNQSFILGQTTKWVCPTCGSGVLKSEKSKTIFEETKGSKADHAHDEWEPAYIRYKFGALLTCTNSDCNDIVSCSGSGKEQPLYDDMGDEIYFESLSPNVFDPPLNIIEVSDKCPQAVVDEIKKSFSLFWHDAPACANKIGRAIELIMDNLKIKSVQLVSGPRGRKRRKSLSLHAQIDGEFRRKKPNIADQFLAIKWIRNSGSHAGKDIDNSDVLDAYEFLEHALEELYDDRSGKIKKKAKEINKAKGPKKRKIRTT